MRTYLLLHGAWHTSECWESFIPALQQTEPCHIYAPNLPGRDAREGTINSIGLMTHVNFLKTEIEKRQTPVHIIAHSLAGVIASQLAEVAPEWVKEIIYIAGYIPQNQQSVQDEITASPFPGHLDNDIILQEGSIALRKTDNVKKILYTLCHDPLASQYVEKLVPEPIHTFNDPLSISPEKFGQIPKKYIRCLQDKAVHPDDQLRMCMRLKNCTIIDLDADHTPQLSAPDALAALFKVQK